MTVDIFLSSTLFTSKFLPNGPYAINKAWKSKFGRGVQVEILPLLLMKICYNQFTGKASYGKFTNICGNEPYLEY